MKWNSNGLPVCLTIAGLDPSGGAGLVADIKTFTAFGCFAAAAVTSVTFQNTTGVFGAEHQTADSVRRQIEAVLDDYDVAAVKTGMLPTREIVEAVADIVASRRLRNVVVDPVVRSTSGFDLMDQAALDALIEKLFPLAEAVTPNIPEAERITGFQITSANDIELAAAKIQSLGARNVLIKGGHGTSGEWRVESGESRKAVDRLFGAIGSETFEADFIETAAARGTGCRLASAIAAELAKGHDLTAAVRAAKEFVTGYIEATSPV